MGDDDEDGETTEVDVVDAEIDEVGDDRPIRGSCSPS